MYKYVHYIYLFTQPNVKWGITSPESLPADNVLGKDTGSWEALEAEARLTLINPGNAYFSVGTTTDCATTNEPTDGSSVAGVRSLK